MMLFLTVALLLSGALGSTAESFPGMTVDQKLTLLYDLLSQVETRDLSDLVQKVRIEILKELELREAQILSIVDEKLLNEKNERLSMDNIILDRLQRASIDAAQKMTEVKDEVASASERGRIATDMLEVQVEANRQLMRGTEEALLQSLARTNESLNERVDGMQTNLAAKIGNLEKSLVALREVCANDTRLTRIENRCSDPPHVESGHPISGGFEGRDHGSVVTYACRGDKVPAGNDRVECLFGKWTGELPRCVDPVCDPPCQNGGACKRSNTCSCTPLFSGDRCQDVQCGLDLRDAVGVNGSGIVGGNTSTSTPDWPWLAAVYRKSGKDSPPWFRCAGSIIHRHFILTAARCAHFNLVRLDETDLTVRLGATDLSDLTHLQEFNVRSIYVHPLYNRSMYWDYNVALLELEKPIEYSLSARPVCLPPQETPGDDRIYEPQSSTVHVVEWLSDTATERHLAVQPTDICRDAFGRNFTDRLFCTSAGDSCLYLHGSPTLRSHRNAGGALVWTLVGVGGGDCRWHGGEGYSLFARLQALMPWVHRTLGG